MSLLVGKAHPRILHEYMLDPRQMPQQAFVLRISPSYIDRVEEAIKHDQIIIGWAEASELLDRSLDWESFRNVLRNKYYADEPNLRKAGNAAGHMWRFLREMNNGDLVVVPHGDRFYVAEVLGEASHDMTRIQDDSAFRRPVRWLNGKIGIPRSSAQAALQSRMKTQGTCAVATDLLAQIRASLELAERGAAPTFGSDLRNALVPVALKEIQSGRLNGFSFQELLKTLFKGLGAEEVQIRPTILDKGADLIAMFRMAGAFSFTVAVQAKHYLPEPPVGSDVVQQLIRGIEAESADLGIVVTSGKFDDTAKAEAEKYFEEKGTKIELIDGDQLAALVVERGLAAISWL